MIRQKETCSFRFDVKYWYKPCTVKTACTFRLLHFPRYAILSLLLIFLSPAFQSAVNHLSCQPLYSQSTGFSAFDNRKPRWLEDKRLTRLLWSPLNALIPDAARKQRAADSSSLQQARLWAHSEDILCGALDNIYQERHIWALHFSLFLSPFTIVLSSKASQGPVYANE